MSPRTEQRLFFWVNFDVDLDFASMEPKSVLRDIDFFSKVPFQFKKRRRSGLSWQRWLLVLSKKYKNLISEVSGALFRILSPMSTRPGPSGLVPHPLQCRQYLGKERSFQKSDEVDFSASFCW